MLRFFENPVYTLDKIVLLYECKSALVQRIFENLSVQPNISYRKSFKMSSCFHNFYVDLPGDRSYYIGITPNWIKSVTWEDYIKIEFNPSKISDDPHLTWLLNVLNNNTYLSCRHVKRFDLAIDFPVSRENLFLRKDSRKYEQHSRSAKDKTEYLGSRSSHGFVKLYNKQIESDLPIPLTRLELTIDYENRSYDEVNRLIPELYYIDDYQLDFEVTGTDKVLFIACSNEINLLSELPRRKKEKIQELLKKFNVPFKLDISGYNNILKQIDEIVNRENKIEI